jgi:quercetin dioxygenase-like cupin family protein
MILGTAKENHLKVYTWDQMPAEELSSSIGRRMITGDRTMMARVYLKKGAFVPEHHHDNEQITFIVSGALEFKLNGETIVLRTGQVMVIPSNMPHSALALEDTDDMDVFTPPRQDWLTGNDAYLRG